MSIEHASVVSPVRGARRDRRAPRPRYHRPEGLAPGLVAGGAAVIAGYTLVRGNVALAVAFSLVPLLVWLVIRPTIPLVWLGASIPELQSLTGGRGGFNVSVSDLLLLLIAAGILLEVTISRSAPAVRALRPLALPLLQYCGALMLLLPIHFGASNVAKTGQRFELFLLPLVIGAFAALKGRHVRILQAYVLASAVVGVIWQVDTLGMQKNPVGQMIANAILLLIAVPALRRLLPCLTLLLPALFLTESRGAIVATVIGVAVIIAMSGFRARTIMKRSVVLMVIAVGVFALLPSAIRVHVTTFSAGTNTAAAYSIHIRQQLSADANHIISAHPWTGVGIGNYGSADALSSAPVQDPHEVLLLQAAEGGYGLAASFVLLVVGVLAVLWTIRTVDVAPAAFGVLAATVVHGLVDVYWVRGTPVLGWLLVGMACGGLARLRPPTPAA